MRIAIQIGIGFCLITYTIAMFFPIWVDIPTEAYANEYLGAINIVTDVYLVCIPIGAVYRLHLPMQKKVGVMMIFFSGVL